MAQITDLGVETVIDAADYLAFRDTSATRDRRILWSNLLGNNPTFASGLTIGESEAVTLSTPGAPFTLHSAQADFNGTRDDVYYWAYNLQPGDTTQRVDTSKAQMKFAIEADYNNGTVHLIEYNFDYMSADGLTNKRPISWAADLSSQDSGLIFAAGKISLLSESNVREWVILTAPLATATNKFVVRAGAAQSGNYFEWQDSAANVLSAINATGGFITSAISSPSGILAFDDTNVRYQRAASATNEKNWAVEVGANTIAWKAYNDAYSAAGTALEITRSGAAITKVTFPTAEMFVSGSNPNIVCGATSALGIGGSSFQLRSASPAVVMENTSAAADNKIWTLGETGSNTLTFRALNDALGAAANWMVVTRSGASISEVSFPSGTTKIATLGISQTPVSETITPTHTFFILLDGVYYKIPCVAA